MLGRNNRKEQIKQRQEQTEHYSIRKLSIGTASILIGLTFWGTASGVRADTQENITEEQAAVDIERQEQTIEKENTLNSDSQTAASNTNSSSNNEEKKQAVLDAAETSSNDASGPTYSDSQDKVNDINNTINKELEDTVNNAGKVDGVTVVEDEKNQVNTTVSDIDKNKDKIEQDNKNQIDQINQELDKHKENLDKYQADLEAYNKARDEYIEELKKLGLWHDGVDPDDISQDLVLGKEENATVDIESVNPGVTKGEGTILNGLLDNFWEIKDPAEGDLLKVTYSGLENSFYGEQKIHQIVITYSDWESHGDGKAGIYFGKNPTDGFFYLNANGVTIDIKFYDENGKQIILKDNTAYITIGSLNSDGTGSDYIEKAEIINGENHSGEGVVLPESSVGVHKGAGENGGDILYSEINNNLIYKNNLTAAQLAEAEKILGKEIVEKYLGWDDSEDRSKEIFGAGLFKVTGDSIQIRFSNNLGSAWATFSTTIPKLTFNQEKPEMPTITIHWQKGELVLIDDPEQPTNPEQPTDPEEPTNPEQPTDPEEPTNPEQPTDPEQTTDPEEPANPVLPEDSDDSNEENISPVKPEQNPNVKDQNNSVVNDFPTKEEKQIKSVAVSSDEVINENNVDMKVKDKVLPETGSSQTKKSGAFGLGVSLLAFLIGLAGAKKRRK